MPIPVLAYHALHAPDKDYASNDHVALEEDLKLIRRLGFRVAPLAEIAELTWNRAPSRLDSGHWVGLSFDDGTDFDYLDIEAHPYLGHLKSFYTILRENGASTGRDWPQPTGTAFVIASPEARAVLDRTCIAGLNQWRDVWWAEAAQTGILEIGNHSWDHTHPTLDSVAQRDQRKGTFMGIDNLADADAQIIRADGTPLPGAELDVWQASDQGFYDVQQPGVQPRANGRGLFTADADGAFWFRTVVPSHYPIPTDGPVGQLLLATERHPYRPAHIHFIVTAPGHRALTTHIFVAGSPYIESDAVFAVKKSLIKEFTQVDDPEQAARYGLDGPFCVANFDIILQPDAEN